MKNNRLFCVPVIFCVTVLFCCASADISFDGIPQDFSHSPSTVALGPYIYDGPLTYSDTRTNGISSGFSIPPEQADSVPNSILQNPGNQQSGMPKNTNGSEPVGEGDLLLQKHVSPENQGMVQSDPGLQTSPQSQSHGNKEILLPGAGSMTSPKTLPEPEGPGSYPLWMYLLLVCRS